MCTCVAVGFFFRTRHIAHLRNGEPRNLGAASRQHPWCERMFLLFVSQFIVVMQRSAFLGANADNKGTECRVWACICRTSWFRLEIYSETEIGFFLSLSLSIQPHSSFHGVLSALSSLSKWNLCRTLIESVVHVTMCARAAVHLRSLQH